MFLHYGYHTSTVQVVLNMSTMAAGRSLNIVCRLCFVIAGHDKIMHIFWENKLQNLCNFILFGSLCTVLLDGCQVVLVFVVICSVEILRDIQALRLWKHY